MYDTVDFDCESSPMAERSRPGAGKTKAGADVDEASADDLVLRPSGLNAPEQAAFQRLVSAIGERRLLPGIRLIEEDLATTFGVSRERIRRILLVMSQYDIVRLEPNRGAYVARPTIRECRDAFDGRRLIERHVVATLAALGPARRRMVVSHLRRHAEAEAEAIRAGDRLAQVRLSGEFHLKMAVYAGNRRLLRMLQELVAQLALALSAHAFRHELDCSIGEHAALTDAINAGDAATADRLLREHLDHLEVALTDDLDADDPLGQL